MKEQIQDALISAGRMLFLTYGFQKTTIQDITKKVGIATGTFYNYFYSKEHLYFVILEQEEKQLQNKLRNLPAISSDQRDRFLKDLLKEVLFEAKKNPFIKQLFLNHELETFIHKLPKDLLTQHFNTDQDTFVTILKLWQKKGFVRLNSSKRMATILRSFFVLMFNKEMIGEEFFEETLEWFIEKFVEELVEGDTHQ